MSRKLIETSKIIEAIQKNGFITENDIKLLAKRLNQGFEIDGELEVKTSPKYRNRLKDSVIYLAFNSKGENKAFNTMTQDECEEIQASDEIYLDGFYQSPEKKFYPVFVTQSNLVFTIVNKIVICFNKKIYTTA